MDHELVNISQLDISCGVFGLSRYDSDVEAVCYAIGTRLYHPARGAPAAFLVWSDVAEGTGEKLATLLKSQGLGFVQTSGAVDNPKTGNIISVWTCMIFHDVWKAWWVTKRKERLAKAGS